LKKGNKVLVEGRLVPDQNTGGPRVWKRNDGTSAASYEINAATIRSIGSRNDSEGSSAGTTGFDDFGEGELDEDEIPF